MLDIQYAMACATPTDINEHLPVLKEYADKCDYVIEFGVRTGMSTRAFLFSDTKKLRSYDLYKDQFVDYLFAVAQEQGKDALYTAANTLQLEIEECDMLFIDTDHTYAQLSQELAIHGNKARKYLAFHDTISYGKELCPAILEFLIENKHWRPIVQRNNNNGLTILERT